MRGHHFVTVSSFASFAPHALNQRSPAEGKGKGQKLLAQGIALGIMAISKTPCKGKSFKISTVNSKTKIKKMEKEGMKYEQAVRELEEIVERMENDELDIDQLSEQLKRAKTLVKLCKDKLTKTDEEIKKLLSED